MPAPEPLPIRPAPYDGEPLAEFVHRLATANGLARRNLPAGVFNRSVPAAALKTIAAWADLDYQRVAAMTLDIYPEVVAGTGPARRGGWRLGPSVRWTCPSCTPRTGRTDLTWQLALTPICRNCKVYLTAGPGEAVAAHDEVIDVVDELHDLLAASITNPHAAEQLGWLREVCAGITAMQADPWRAGRSTGRYPLPDWGSEPPYCWNAYPSDDPGTVVAVLMSAVPALPQRQITQKLQPRTLFGVQREQRHYRSGLQVLADGISEAETFHRRRLRRLQQRLEHAGAAWGLAPRHVPGWLPGTDEHHPGIDIPASLRWQAAITMHKLLARIISGPTTLPDTYRAFGVNPDTFPATHYEHRHRLHSSGASWRLAATAIGTLLDEGLIDYQRRRDALRPLTRLPRHVHLPHRLPDLSGIPGEQLALGWIWQHLTRGPIWTSHLNHLTDALISRFDTLLDPETRLVLHDAGMQHITDSELPTANPVRPARRRVPSFSRTA